MPFVLIRGISAAELLRLNASAAQIAAVLHDQTRRMQQLALRLSQSGIPLRSFLTPYVDTVQLQNPSAAFFGDCLLISCEATQQGFLRTLCAEFPSFTVSCFEESRFFCRPIRLTAKRRALLQNMLTLPQEDPSLPLLLLSFPAPSLEAPFLLPQERRAQAREVLAFGEICARVIRNAGGTLLSCAGGLLCASVPQDYDALCRNLQELYWQRMAPHCAATTAPLQLQLLFPDGRTEC